MKYTHIFFDLDHTLWDYDYNARKVLMEIYDHFDLEKTTNTTSEGFLRLFFKVNAALWHRYNLGIIGRDEIRNDRFPSILRQCKGDPTKGDLLSDYFLHHCPRQPKIIDGADQILAYLSEKYKIYIITNGFDDVQWIKLKASGLGIYVHDMYTSETIGHRKPSKEIFEYALSETKTTPELSVMVGDNPVTDIDGANNAGLFSVLFDPTGQVKAKAGISISRFDELRQLL
ncbi:MAG: YjjG family noncanonical pyrimidine nucleotidase [Bacteroidota bacterium]